jgi:beta-N-acetylhexosaminidase
MMVLKRLSNFAVLAAFIAASLPWVVPVHAQSPETPEPFTPIETLLNSMTPEERVGQLFLVTFTGTDTGAGSQIYDLIVRHHIGGVVLLASSDNFVGAPDTVGQAYDLISRLQTLEWDSAINMEFDPNTGERLDLTYVPLFVGITQEGNGYPTDQILNGLTSIPSEMAIGATWDTNLAAEVGSVLGRELSALGVNLYLGPSLDVLETPKPLASGDLGTRVFGGDPYWVGEMGRAFINGLHLGSDHKLMVIAKHFPGRGGSDRLPEEEVSTVRKSLEQLKQIELAPFFAVTGNAPSPEAAADGLLVSHIRYQGLQGNIRATTKPVSFDAQALAAMLALPQFSTWYSQGGLVVSDDLGTRAVREFYSPESGGSFSARTVARDAFLAGNDLLYLGQITSREGWDTYTTTISILDFFSQKYREDPAFAERVDASVRRILAMKFRMYGVFSLTNVLAPGSGLEVIQQSSDVSFRVARSAATLISPDPQEFKTVLPSPPDVNDQLVFITDSISVQQCSVCSPQPAIAVDAMEQTILRLYGPRSGNQAVNFRISSFSFENLQAMLDGLDPPFIEDDIGKADWVIISTTDSSRGQPGLISRFLSERQGLLRSKHVILFSFGAPYYFDSTDISNLTAYFALYSSQPPFVEAAARLLFQELTPSGASPVSIPGIGYDLITIMAPDADQIISLSLDLPPAPVAAGTPGTPEPTPIPLFQIGNTIAIRTGTILDHNGHAVPDGTVVRFSMILTGEGGGILQQVEATTTQGVARASFGLDKPGLLEIRAVSEPATLSDTLQLDVSQTGAVAVTVVVPQLTEEFEPTPVATAPPEEEGFVTQEGFPRFNAWFLAMFLIAFSVVLGLWFGGRLVSRKAGTRWAFGILLGGLASYNYLALGLPGGTAWLTSNGLAGVLMFVVLGEVIGFAGGWFWSRRP